MNENRLTDKMMTRRTVAAMKYTYICLLIMLALRMCLQSCRGWKTGIWNGHMWSKLHSKASNNRQGR